MWILIQMLIPVATIIALKHYFNKEVHFIEMVGMFTVTMGLTVAGFYYGKDAATADTEYFTNSIVKIRYYEPYSTWVSRTCSYQCNCHTVYSGTGKYRTSRQECSTCYRDCSYCNEYAEAYIVTLNSGETYGISPQRAMNIIESFGGQNARQFIELGRTIVKHGSCGKDGDAYDWYWDGRQETAHSYSRTHQYKNPLLSSQSIFKTENIDNDSLKGTYDYDEPRDGYQYKLIGIKNPSVEHYLQWFNGKYGMQKQLNYMVFAYKNAPKTLIYDQQKRLQGGNKNECILQVSLDDNWKVQWANYITYSNIKYELPLNGIELEPFVTEFGNTLSNKWVRTQFAIFDYIEVHPSPKCFWIFFFINIAVLVIGGFYITQNSLNNDNINLI